MPRRSSSAATRSSPAAPVKPLLATNPPHDFLYHVMRHATTLRSNLEWACRAVPGLVYPAHIWIAGGNLGRGWATPAINWSVAHHICILRREGPFLPRVSRPKEEAQLGLYQCHNCAGFVHVLWSAGEFASMRGGLYGYKVLPWPLAGKPEPSKNWPDGMKRFWVQAHDSLSSKNWDAAAVMARSALQFVVREKGAKKGKLYSEVEDLATKGVLHPLMAEWSHEVRELGNDSAYPEPTARPTERQDAKDIVNFLDFLQLEI